MLPLVYARLFHQMCPAIDAVVVAPTGGAQLVCCAIVMVMLGIIQGGQAGEQLLAGSVCAAAFLRCAGIY
jgi:hypothetical protein